MKKVEVSDRDYKLLKKFQKKVGLNDREIISSWINSNTEKDSILYQDFYTEISEKDRETLYKIFDPIGESPGKIFNTKDDFSCNIKSKKNKITTLNFYKKKIDKFPKEILELKNLENLYFFDVPIKEIPEGIKELGKLESFTLINGKLKNLPREFANLKNLKYLNFSKNELSILPDYIFYFNKLEYLDFEDNKINLISDKIFDLEKLEELWISKPTFDNEANHDILEKLLREKKDLEIWCNGGKISLLD